VNAVFVLQVNLVVVRCLLLVNVCIFTYMSPEELYLVFVNKLYDSFIQVNVVLLEYNIQGNFISFI